MRPRSVIVKNTVEALQSGSLYGFASQVDGLVGRMLAEECTCFTARRPWLTLLGREIVYSRNS